MANSVYNSTDKSQVNYQKTRIEHWDRVARKMDTWRGWGGYYHRRLTEVFRHLMPPGQRIIEIGCAQGDLLAALKPAFGVGVDFSREMIQRATKRHPELRFVRADAHDLNLNEKFDFIILSDLVNDLWDVQAVFQQVMKLTTARSRVIINTYSRLWELPLLMAKGLGLGRPILFQNWLTVEDITGLLNLANFEVIRHWEEVLCPLPIPILGTFLNRVVVKSWPFKLLALTYFIVARPQLNREAIPEEPLVSVVVPARNEAGNIPQIFTRTPEMGQGTELIFVEGHSTDDTYPAIERAMAENPQRRCKLLRQTGVGSGPDCAAGRFVPLLWCPPFGEG